jgi:hypothetical protein
MKYLIVAAGAFAVIGMASAMHPVLGILVGLLVCLGHQEIVDLIFGDPSDY